MNERSRRAVSDRILRERTPKGGGQNDPEGQYPTGY